MKRYSNKINSWVLLFCCLMVTNLAISSDGFEPIPDVLKTQRSITGITANSWILVEPESGWILASHDVDKRIEPASLTKLMTIYVVFQQLKRGELTLHEKVLISKKAWRMEGSRMFAEVGDRISVIKMLKGVIVQSGNDASVAIAEHVAGSEQAFVTMMNSAAKQLKMNGTNFENVTGLPGDSHYSTAYDVALLSAQLINEFPDYYAWFAIKEFEHNNIKQPNRNLLLKRNIDVDGLKTGHTESAGYCLAASSKRKDVRFITVVTGLKSASERADQAAALLEFGHSNYMNTSAVNGSGSIDLRVYGSSKDNVLVEFQKQNKLIKPKYDKGEFKYRYELPRSVVAPLLEGQTISIAELVYNDVVIDELPMLIAEDAEKGSLYKRGIDKIKRLIDEF